MDVSIKKSNQSIEAIVTTPVDKDGVVCTQPHLKRSADNMKKIFFILSLLLIFIISGCKNDVPEGVTNKKEYRSGADAAKNDLNKGVIRYEMRGISRPYFGELRDLAKERYKVEIDFSGCLGYPRVDYAKGYKDTVIKCLIDAYSYDPIPDLLEEVSK